MHADLLEALTHKLNGEWRRDGRYHADCVFCGKEAKRGQKHFSFVAEGYKCWVCGAKGGLTALADQLAVDGPRTIAPRPAPAPVEPRRWQTDPRVLERYAGAHDTLPAWTGYKPLTIETIARARLGVGVLPSSRSRHRRLILPVFSAGKLVALHGRAFLPGDEDAKWLTAGGSRKDVLYGAESLQAGCTVIVCENLVDSLLARQRRPDVVAVASGGVSWSEAFTQQLVAARPRHVLVWLDNDLAGAPNPATYARLRAAWLREMEARLAEGKIAAIPTPPEPQGPPIANDLLAAGVKASVYQWPNGTPARADLGWALMQDERKAA